MPILLKFKEDEIGQKEGLCKGLKKVTVMDPKILIEALEIEKSGDWDRSHRTVQQYLTPDANWVHAYLHRKEGVLWNARYWYERANRPVPDYDLETEWQELYDHVKSTK